MFHEVIAVLEALALAFEEVPRDHLYLRSRDCADKLRPLIDSLTEIAPQTSETLPRYVRQLEFWDQAVVGCFLGEGHRARLFGSPILDVTQVGGEVPRVAPTE